MPIQPLSSENVLLWISYQLFLFPFKNVCLNCFHKNAELDFPTMLIFNFTKLPCTPFFRNVLVILWVDEKPNMTSACPRERAIWCRSSSLQQRFHSYRVSLFRQISEQYANHSPVCSSVWGGASFVYPAGNQTPTCMILIEYRYLACLLDSQSSWTSNKNSRSLPPVSASSLSFERTRCLGGLRGPRFVYLYLSLNSSSASLGYIPYQGVLIKSACR